MYIFSYFDLEFDEQLEFVQENLSFYHFKSEEIN